MGGRFWDFFSGRRIAGWFWPVRAAETRGSKFNVPGGSSDIRRPDSDLIEFSRVADRQGTREAGSVTE
jgi:hypothetical protein